MPTPDLHVELSEVAAAQLCDLVPAMRLLKDEAQARRDTHLLDCLTACSIKRQRAVRENNHSLTWAAAPTGIGEAIDPLFAHNLSERSLFLKSKFYSGNGSMSEAA